MDNITEKKLRYWLTLFQAPEIGIARIKKLLTYFNEVEMIFKASAKELSTQKLHENQINIIKNPNQKWNDDTIQWLLSKKNNHIILFTDPRYPALLRDIVSAPPILYVQGDADLLTQPQIAMVGSRNPSRIGLEIAEEFSFLLSQAGLVVTSGLALGIDAASHQGALNAGKKTIAVLGNGLNTIYPKINTLLAEKIIDNGCLVSEFHLHETPTTKNFPRRNRIISGLSLGTLVIEAALKSGSLITARYAMEQNRDVFAIPGSIRNPTSQGCLSLIQNGAKCVTRIEDILEEIKLYSHGVSTEKIDPILNTPLKNNGASQNKLDRTEQQVLACIDDDVTTIDQICERSTLSAQQVSSALLELEVNDVVKRYQGGYMKSHVVLGR